MTNDTKNKIQNELQKLIPSAKQGDEHAFEQIAKYCHKTFTYLSRKYFLKSGEPEDIYQILLINLIDIIKHYDERKSNFLSFVYLASNNRVKTLLSKEQAKKRLIINSSVSIDNEVNCDDDVFSFHDILATDEIYIHRYVEDETMDRYLEEFKTILSEFELFVLKAHLQKYTYRDISQLWLEKTGDTVSKKTVDNALYRLRAKLREYYTIKRDGNRRIMVRINKPAPVKKIQRARTFSKPKPKPIRPKEITYDFSIKRWSIHLDGKFIKWAKTEAQAIALFKQIKG